MGKLKNRGRAAIITGGLMLGGHGLEASAQNQDSIPENGKDKIESVSNKTNGELAIDLSKKQNLDSLYNISGKIENLLKNMDKEGNINMYYGQDQYFEKLSKLVKKYETEMKKSGLCNDLFKCGEVEFDKRMNEIEQEITLNLDNYGHFDSKGNFNVNKENYEKLIKDKFPEFYESTSKDAFLDYWDKEYKVHFEKHRQKIEYTNDNGNGVCIGVLCFIAGFFIWIMSQSLSSKTIK